MASYNNAGRDNTRETLLQQLRGKSQSDQQDEPHQAPAPGQYQQQPQQQPQPQSGYKARYDGPPSHGAPGSNGDYEEEDDIMPPAPTPPVNNMPASVLAYMSNSGGNSIGAPRAPPNSDHTNNLLNLLNFKQPATRQDPQSLMSSSAYQPRIVAPAPVGQDPTGLLAAMISGVHEEPKDTPPPIYAKAASPPSTSTTDAQSILLGLLNRPKPAQTDQPQQFTSESAKSNKSITLTPQSTNDSNADYNRDHQQHFQPLPHSFNTTSPAYSRHSDSYGYQHVSPPEQNQSQHRAQDPTPTSMAHPESSGSARGPAGYSTNPFADAARSSPMDKTPKSSSLTPAAPGSTHSHQSSVQILKKSSIEGSPRSAGFDTKPASERSYAESPENFRREAPFATQTQPHEQVSESAEDMAGQEPANLGANESKETVANAVSELAPKLDREVQEALAHRVEEEQMDGDFGQNVKSQPEVPEEESPVEDTPRAQNLAPEPIHEIGHDAAAEEPVVDNWEHADADADTEDVAVAEDGSEGIPVYNFPMRPWIGLRLLENDKIERPNFRDNAITDTTRLKKEFDQIDRNLVTASESHIIYGMSRNGGLRVISQDDGCDAKLFTDTQDRIFNVSVSLSPGSEHPVKEAIIGTGISGTVYWILIKDGDEDHIADNHPEQYGFALPPINSQEGDAPGGVLKTRARPSSMHPEYFAIGRGKTIHMIWPSLIMQGNLFKPGHDRVVDVDSLLSRCSLKINTGKAGKDFTFSADDTTIVTLDKAGKVKFWDIRTLTEPQPGSDHQSLPNNTDLELKEPILSLNTTCEGEKPWPTSVLLVDKPKPYQRRTAQRYMIVGTKQNHSFQLWDLTLRKVVQEINLPHGKDSDAACSIMYHAITGMIIIGHPTRNTVYFLHLSAPKYTLKLSQVDYMTRLATPDSYVPMPDCTAVLSGYREINFSSSGTLRSLDLLPTPASTEDPEAPVLFELYAMHSKGVSCVHVRQRDLGWAADNRVKNPKDAMKAGVVTISKISSPPQLPSASETVAAGESSTSQTPIRVIHRRDGEEVPSVTSVVGRGRAPAPAPMPVSALANVAESSSSAAPPKNSAANASHPDPAPIIAPHQPADKPDKPKGKRKKGPPGEDKSSNNSPRPSNKEAKNSMSQAGFAFPTEQLDSMSAKMESNFNARISELGQQLDGMNTRIDVSLDARERAFDLRSREILKMVSQQLNTNTQNLLTELVRSEFETRVVPTISKRTTEVLTDHLNGPLGSQVSLSIQQEISKVMPAAITHALADPETVDYMAKLVSAKVKEQVQNELVAHVFPGFETMAKTAVQKSQREFEQTLKQTTDRLEYSIRAESSKVDHLVGMVQSLQETVKTMATTQSQFQAEILKLQQRQFASPAAVSQPGPVVPPAPTYPTQPVPKPSMDPGVEQAITGVASLMRDELYEAALVRWLQSNSYLNDIFEHYYYNVSPGFLAQVSPLVQLSVAATISEHVNQGKFRERVVWLETLIHSFSANLNDSLDEQVRDITPKIMGLVITRVENVLMEITRQAPHDPVLKSLSNLIAAGNHIVQATQHSDSPSTQSDHRQVQQYQGQTQAPYEQAQYPPNEQMQHHQHQAQPQGQPQWY